MLAALIISLTLLPTVQLQFPIFIRSAEYSQLSTMPVQMHPKMPSQALPHMQVQMRVQVQMQIQDAHICAAKELAS